MRLSDDWQGADFIAQHIDGETFLKVQLKGRLTFSKKYMDKDLYIAFFENPDWYLFPHDEVLAKVIAGVKFRDGLEQPSSGASTAPHKREREHSRAAA